MLRLTHTIPVAACFAGAPWQQRCYLSPALNSIACYCSLEALIFLQAVGGQETRADISMFGKVSGGFEPLRAMIAIALVKPRDNPRNLLARC
jgi:hypothetical protein